ncbi:hypothetical protein AgCh_016231 [Apium graveolens]
MNGDHVTSLEELDTRCMDSVWLAIKTSWKMNDYSRSVVDHGIKMSSYEILEGRQRRSPLCYDEVVERKMLGPAVVQRTKDMIDLIRGRLVVAQDGHDTKG